MHLPEKWRRELIALTIWEGMKSLYGSLLGAALIVGSAYVAAHRSAGGFDVLHKHSLAVGFFFGVLGGGLISWLYYVTQFYPPHRRQSYDFEISEKTVSFEYNENGRYQYRRRLSLKAMRHGLRSFHDKYKWTGRTVPRLSSNNPDQSVVLGEKRSIWQFYEIRFGRALNKGETVETDLFFDIIDSEHSFVPFISATIEEPTKQLTLILISSGEALIQEAGGEIAETIGARVPYRAIQLKADHDGRIIWRIGDPKMFQHYELRWNLPKETSHDKRTSAITGK